MNYHELQIWMDTMSTFSIGAQQLTHFCIYGATIWSIRRTCSHIKRQTQWKVNSIHAAHWQGVLSTFILKAAAVRNLPARQSNNSWNKVCNRKENSLSLSLSLTYTHTVFLSALVSVMDGESVARSCIQQTNCPSPIRERDTAAWFVKDGGDVTSLTDKGHQGWRQTWEKKRWIWRKL